MTEKKQRFTDATCSKTLIECYSITFNKGREYMNFTLSEDGTFTATGSYGNFGHKFYKAGHETMKEFVTSLCSDYVLRKFATKRYFDGEKYERECKTKILELRKSRELNDETARKAWELFDEYLDYYTSFDCICQELYNSEFEEIFGYYHHESDFAPEQEYHPNDITFAYDVFPLLVNILKKEIEDERHQN